MDAISPTIYNDNSQLIIEQFLMCKVHNSKLKTKNQKLT